MAKQSISIKDTKISNSGAYGNQIEQTVSVDDNILPAPQELAEYQRIEPKIVEFLIKSYELVGDVLRIFGYCCDNESRRFCSLS